MLNSAYMVRPYIKEGSCFKGDSVHSVVLECLAGDLHGHIPDTGFKSIVHVLIKLHDLRSCQVGLLLNHSVIVVYSGANRSSLTACLSHIVVEYITHIIGGRRLALSSCDADHRQLIRQFAVKCLCYKRHSFADICYCNANASRSHRKALIRLDSAVNTAGSCGCPFRVFPDITDSSRCDRVLQILLPEVSALYHEQYSGLSFP